jgi:TPR repeat protein
MAKRSVAGSAVGCVGLAMLALAAAPTQAAAQSAADVALCDRLAADPSDPDKPKDVTGVIEVAPADVATAIKYCRALAGKSRRAMYQLGRAYAASQQWPDAIDAFRKAADKGSTSAMVELGVALASGTGIAKDEVQAASLLERAAEAGNSRGAVNLAVLVNNGGAAADRTRLRALLTRAAETNSAEAQYQLGLMLADGTGGPRDDAGARRMFDRAAAQNHPGALERMGAFAEAGRGGPKDAGAAKTYYEKAVALGNEDAKAALKRAQCPIQIRDKRGNRVSDLCF